MMHYRIRLEILLAVILIFYATIVSFSASAQHKLKSGEIFKDCPDCPEMTVISQGTFTMGSPENEAGYSAVEGPQRRVSITLFAAAKFDVTRGQWEAFVNATNRPVKGGCAFSGFEDNSCKGWEPDANASWRNPGFPQDSTHPVVCITWNDTQDYING